MAISYNVLSVQSNKALVQDHKSDPDKQAKTDLDEQVKHNKEASIDYQIIKKTLFRKKDEYVENDPRNRRKNLESNQANKSDSLSISSEAEGLSKESMNVSNSNVLEASVNTSIRRSDEMNLTITSSGAEVDEVKQKDPLALDLNGNGFETTGIHKGVLFDIDGDGVKERTSFISGGDAFLAYDQNGNGVIDDGKELFGDSNGYEHGFSELSTYDDDNDGKIDSSDAIYSKLKLLSLDEDGQQQLNSLSQMHIKSINLNYSNRNEVINQYDSIAQVGQFEYDDGKKGNAGDLLLGYKT